jgi:endonuclease V-like protein UPF0215 family
VDQSPSSDDPVIAAYQRDVDISLIRENLRKTPEERLKALQELQRFAAELQRAGDELRSRGR